MATTVADLEVRVGADTSDADRGLSGLSGRLRGMSQGDVRAASAAFLGLGASIAGGLGIAITTAAEFEAAIDSIGVVAGLTGDELAAVEQLAIELGASTTFSATEAAGAMDTLLRAGMGVETVMDDGARAALNLAAAAGTDVVTAAELMTSAINVFGAAAGSATDVANIFNAAANVSAASIESLGLGFSQAALTAQLMGLSLEDLAVALALFSQNGLQGSDAGTSFKTMLLSMLDPTAEQAALMNQLGISFFDANGNFIGLDATAAMLQGTLAGLTEEERNTALATLFGADAVRAATILYNEGADGIATMRTEMEGQGTAADQAAARMDNLKGAMETLKGWLETAAILIGTQLTPYVQDLAVGIQGLVGWFTGLDPAIQGNIAKGAALAAGLLLLAGALGMAALAMGPLIAGFALLTGPIGLTVAALAGLYVAYQTNFLGFRDGVHSGLGMIQGAIGRLGPVVSAFGLVFGAVWPTLSQAAQTAWTGIKTVIDGLTLVFQGMATTVGGIVKLFVGAITLDFGLMKDGVSGIVDGLRMQLEGHFNVIKGAGEAILGSMAVIVGDIFSGIKENAGAVIGEMKDAVIRIVGELKENAVASFTELKDDARAVVDAMGYGIEASVTWLKDRAYAIFTGIKDDAVGVFNAIKSETRAVIDGMAWDTIGVIGWLKDAAYGAAVDAGKAVVQGIIDGIDQMWDFVVSKASALAGAVKDAIGNPLEIFSPSRVTTWMGEMLGVGMAKGITSSIPDVRRAASGLASAATVGLGSDSFLPRSPAGVGMAPAQIAPVGGSPVRHVTVVQHVYQVTPERLTTLMEQAKRAADFVDELPRARQLTFATIGH